jgi:SWI/SNF-related matrix-associated actin-dependent regulator 1 of chromatin subfamily A
MLKTPMYPFQKTGVRLLNEFDGRALLADEVGLGKTLQALYYGWRFVPDDPSGPIVVLCPAHLKIMWARQALQHLQLRVEILDGRSVPDTKLPPHDPNQIYVVNYEVLTPPHWGKGVAPPADSWLVWLANLKPRLVICDEAQRMKTPATAANRAGEYLAKRVRHFLLLSGTPMTNKPGDLWALVHMIRPRLFPSRMDFLTQFTHMTRHWWGWQSKGAKNLRELHRVLSKTCMVRRTKAEVLDQLPPVQYSVIPMQIDMREYRKAELNYLGWLEQKSPTLAASAARAEEVSRQNGLKMLAGKLKVPAVVAWAEDLLAETGGKLLVGIVHHDVSRLLMRAFGARAVLVDGTMSGPDKQRAWDRFNKNPNCELMVGNLQAAGTGQSCTCTGDVAVCEMPWVPADLEQFAGRVHGIGRGVAGTNSHVRMLVAHETIEDDICQLLQTKRGWAAQAIDGTTDVGTFNLHDQIRARIQARHAG